MGLIKAALNAVSGTLADQYKEYIYCDALTSDILAAKARKRVGSKGTNNGADNIITNGSAIAVNEGQCALIVADGKVVEVAAEAGVFEYKSDMSPSVFAGDLGDAIINTLKDLGSRITYGGEAGRDQRVYYINTKEILDNKYGTVNPIPFRVLDKNIGLDVDVTLRCNGEYTYRITNPVLFYTNVCGNVPDVYRRSTLDSTLKSEVVTALQPALAKISELGVRPSGLPGHTLEICDALNEILSKKWGELRGLHIESFNMNPPTLSKEDQAMITDLQRKAVYRNADMGMAHLVEAQGDAMKIAAGNQGGAMMGFMGMNMAQQAGGFNAQNMMAMQQQQAMAQQQAAPAPQAAPAAPAAPAAGTWKCSCGTDNTGKFCANCGTPKPADTNFWSCACGAQNKGKFCSECGKPKPAGTPLYKCDKCGWEPEDPKNPPKFCPECGDPFDADDIV
ncbi:MAG: SPFH domain-containing protein [Oscillospiraceae bacterium]|nr:SPFH domain-containing protein [Oscillospiraceae bacterium]